MKLADLQAIKKQYNKAIKENGKKLLKEEFKVFFDTIPEVDKIVWRQYTPYFNDGETCYFSAEEFRVRIEDEYDSYGSYGDGSLTVDDFDKDHPRAYQEEIVKIMDSSLKQRIHDALKTLNDNANDDDLLEAVFGDHVEIIATREGFDVEEFEHE